MFTVDDRWALGQDPLHPLMEAIDEAYWKPWLPAGQTREELLPAARLAIRARGAANMGPGLPFAHELYGLTGVPVGLVSCALGGSSLEQWNPARRDEGGNSLYGAMMRRAAAAGAKIRGLLWYQGESDSLSDAASTYQRRFREFVCAVRRDLNEPDLCVLYVQIGRFKPTPDFAAVPTWDGVREAQRLGEPDLGCAAVVPAHDATLEDLIHIDGPGQELIGGRLARQAARECFGRSEFRRGPRLAEVALDEARVTVTIRFTEVNGRLRAEGRPVGFSITDASGSDVTAIRRVDLPADRPDTVELRLGMALPEGAMLWYARGLDPSANLTDDQDSGMLAFGPVAIPSPAQ
jgi:sialate O-acetylesterase